MKINQTKQVAIDAKTLSIQIKVRDQFAAALLDAQGDVIAEQENGYVPDFMPGDHYGDYLILEIDIDTGMITNWKHPTPEQIEKFIVVDKE